MLDFSDIEGRETCVVKADVAFTEAQKHTPDMEYLRSLIANMDDDEKSKLVLSLIRAASDTDGNPEYRSVPLSIAIENCLKAGLNPNYNLSPNHRTIDGSILDYYTSPKTVAIYKHIINEFGGFADEENQELFLLKGLFSDAFRTEFTSQLSKVFNYLITKDNVTIAQEAGVPVAEGWEQEYSTEDVVLAIAIQDYINKTSQKNSLG